MVLVGYQLKLVSQIKLLHCYLGNYLVALKYFLIEVILYRVFLQLVYSSIVAGERLNSIEAGDSSSS